MNTFLSTVQKLPESHPVRVYYKEAHLIQKLIGELEHWEEFLRRG